MSLPSSLIFGDLVILSVIASLVDSTSCNSNVNTPNPPLDMVAEIRQIEIYNSFFGGFHFSSLYVLKLEWL